MGIHGNVNAEKLIHFVSGTPGTLFMKVESDRLCCLNKNAKDLLEPGDLKPKVVFQIHKEQWRNIKEHIVEGAGNVMKWELNVRYSGHSITKRYCACEGNPVQGCRHMLQCSRFN